jgi:hypothetical protein
MCSYPGPHLMLGYGRRKGSRVDFAKYNEMDAPGVPFSFPLHQTQSSVVRDACSYFNSPFLYPHQPESTTPERQYGRQDQSIQLVCGHGGSRLHGVVRLRWSCLQCRSDKRPLARMVQHSSKHLYDLPQGQF